MTEILLSFLQINRDEVLHQNFWESKFQGCINNQNFSTFEYIHQIMYFYENFSLFVTDLHHILITKFLKRK